ncbi:Syntaxin-6 [Actinomortierella wolfii]|nr:Syntaxin-6 [Actinomortierella wolfii]
MEDPFILIKNEVVSSLSSATQLFESWKRIIQTVTSADNEELVKTREELDQLLEGIEQDLEDLEGAVQVVLENPQRFNLTTREANARKQFLDQTRRKVQSIKSTLAKPIKISNDQMDRLALLERPEGSSSPRGYQKPSRRDNVMYSNTKFVEQEAMQQQMLFQEQEEQLDSVMHTVLNMREIATVMGDELREQSDLLDDLDEHVDRTQNRLQSAIKRVEIFLKKNEESKSTCCIGILIMILIVLLILVIAL